MEIIIGLVIVAILGYIVYNAYSKKESVDTSSAAPYKVESSVVPVLTQVLDVNKDGKVDVADAVAAVEVVKTKTKKAATKVKETVKKATKKPAVKKAPAKKAAKPKAK